MVLFFFFPGRLVLISSLLECRMREHDGLITHKREYI